MKSIIAAYLIVLCATTTNAQIIINEYSCSNRNIITDFFGDNTDWVELYNVGGAAVDISGYFMSDNDGDLNKWQIPAGVSIPAGGYQLVFFSKRDTLVGGELHTSFGLTQTKNEWIIITTGGGSVEDSLKIINMTQKNHSYGRTTDADLNWSIFTTPTPGASNTGGLNYYTNTPTLSIAPGFYPGAQSVTMSTPDPLATIHYTTDGTTPTTGSPVYSAAVNVAITQVVRAKAFSSDPNTPASFTETNTYFINDTYTVPVLSVCGDQITGFLENSAGGAFNNNFDGAFELFEENGAMVSEGEGYFNKHGNDSWAYDQRGFDWIVRDEYGYTNAVRHPMFPTKNRDEYQRIVVKAAANDNYPFADGAHLRDAMVHTLSQEADLRMDERTSRFAVVFVDGAYWGFYDLREKVDDADFTNHYYNQDKFNIHFLKTWGATWAEYGGQPALDEWDAFKNYVAANDMTVQANYDYVKSVYNTGSLIDYVVLNSYIVTSDWLNWNTAWWHGEVPEPEGDKQKWRYILWDNDASWGHYINYTGIPNTGPDADPCNPEILPDPGNQGHVPILNKLMTNDEFSQQYITRYADLMNSYFSCDYMNALLDSFLVIMTPEMPAQIARWGGDMASWNQNVQDLRDFIDQRCLEMSSGMVDCYNLTGPFDVTFDVQPPGAGEIKVNSLWLPTYPNTGEYYGNINTIFRANDFAGWDFDHWESANHTILNPLSLEDTLDFMSNDTIIAFFVEEPDTTTTPPGGGGGGGTTGPPPNPSTFTGVYIPNAFSPNDDNNNDILELFVGWDVTTFDFMVYDRWGNLMWQTSTYGDTWDGRYKGKIINTGIYTFTMIYESSETGSGREMGNITVIR